MQTAVLKEEPVHENGYVLMAARGVVALRGPDTRPLLQGLITNDLDRLTPERAIYAALLTPQGKFLFDFIMLDAGDEILLEVEQDRLPALIQRLTLYRLRSKVEISDASDRFRVHALLGPDLATRFELEPRPGTCRRLGGGLACLDPRLLALGARALLPPEQAQASLESLKLERLAPDAYERLRLGQGVPDGSRDLVLERATLLESGFEELNGVDFKKGCFVGQELTARMKYRGLVRKRLMPVEIDGPAPEPGTMVSLVGKDAGEMRTSAGNRGLALLRLERVAAARRDGAPLRAGDAVLTPQRPEWANFVLD